MSAGFFFLAGYTTARLELVTTLGHAALDLPRAQNLVRSTSSPLLVYPSLLRKPASLLNSDAPRVLQPAVFAGVLALVAVYVLVVYLPLARIAEKEAQHAADNCVACPWDGGADEYGFDNGGLEVRHSRARLGSFDPLMYGTR